MVKILLTVVLAGAAVVAAGCRERRLRYYGTNYVDIVDRNGPVAEEVIVYDAPRYYPYVNYGTVHVRAPRFGLYVGLPFRRHHYYSRRYHYGSQGSIRRHRGHRSVYRGHRGAIRGHRSRRR